MVQVVRPTPISKTGKAPARAAALMLAHRGHAPYEKPLGVGGKERLRIRQARIPTFLRRPIENERHIVPCHGTNAERRHVKVARLYGVPGP